MLSNRQVTVSVCAPERFTVGFAASVNGSLAIEQEVASGSHVATVLKATPLKVPALPIAFCHALGPPPGPAVQLTSLADQVVAPATGGVNDAALPLSEILNCFVAVPSTMFWTAIATLLCVVEALTSLTLNEMLAGTVTRACSATAAVKVVAWPVSGRAIVV